ncbi:CBS domain-containing protein [Halosimplex aquaticum]
MTDSVPTVTPDTTIAEAADEMSAQSTQRVLVSDGSELFGVLSEHDLMTASPFAPTANGPAAEAGERAVAGVSAGRGAGVTESGENERFTDQSVCEACGSLSRGLSPFNGQLLCADCRDI